MKPIVAFCLFLFTSVLLQAAEEPVSLRNGDVKLEGVLVYPEVNQKVPVVLIIAGSGPTDRNGNNMSMENNSLKYISDVLLQKNIATLRYDKRGIGQSSKGELDPLFEDFVSDAKALAEMLAKDSRFSEVIIAGHSEGSLIGMIVAHQFKKVKGFISIAGAGRPADVVIKEQLNMMPADMQKIAFEMLDRVKQGDTIKDVPYIYYAILNPSVQPYLTSWFKYDPAKELSKLKIPVLIVQGTTDVQVKEVDAHKLAEGLKSAQLAIISNMNHVLKTCLSTDKKENLKTYDDVTLPLNEDFTKVLISFIEELHPSKKHKKG